MYCDWRRSALIVLMASGIFLAVSISRLVVDNQPAEAGEQTASTDESSWQKAKRDSGEATDSVGAAIKETAGKVWGATKSTASKVWGATKKTSRKAWNATKEAASDAGDGVKEGAEHAGDAIKGD